MNLGKVLNKLSTIFLYTRKYKNFMQKIKYIKYQEKKVRKKEQYISKPYIKLLNIMKNKELKNGEILYSQIGVLNFVKITITAVGLHTQCNMN